MIRDISQFTKSEYDVLVIGGGINGAAIAHMAALNGMKVALLEKGDFASGTSSKSTKLVHGGLRYLENFELGLVRESLRERHVQLEWAPHLVHPLRFVVPVYEKDKRPLWMMKLGVWLYDFLSGKYVIEKHQSLTADEVSKEIPGIKREGLLGGVAYSDAQMNDARLCLENVLSAAEKGAHVANYVEVKSLILENGKAVGVKAYDALDKITIDIRAKKVVCAIGPWTNPFMRKENSQSPPMIRTTKGVHIIVKGRLANDAVLIPAKNDKRIFFLIPWLDNTLIGTTDTDYTGPADDIEVTDEDIDYLLDETRRVLPDADLSEDKILTAFAGLRPLVREKGSPSKVSRKHVIKTSYTGMIYVLGGKYTAYRKIAEEVTRKLTDKDIVNTQNNFPVYGSGEIEETAEDVARTYNMASDVVQDLMDFYGVRYKDVMDYIDEDPALKEPICTCSPTIGAQIAYAIDNEMAITEEDIMDRRLLLGYMECSRDDCRAVINELLSTAH